MDLINLNNVAPSMQDHDAIDALSKALATLREAVHASMETEESVRYPPCSCPHHIPPITIASTHGGNGVSMAVENAFEFYDKLFMVSFDGCCCCCQEQLDKFQNMMLAIISKFDFSQVSLPVMFLQVI